MSGPVDFQQLQLENAELIDVLRSKNSKVIQGRKAISSTRKTKNTIKDRLALEQEKAKSYQKEIAANQRTIPKLDKSLAELARRLKVVEGKTDKCEAYLKGSIEQEDFPTLDGYIQLKLDLERLQWQQKVQSRQQQASAHKLGGNQTD